MTDALTIVNPASANGATAARWPALHDALRRAWPGRLDVIQTRAPGHATRLAAAARGYDHLVVCVGGDGTLNEVVDGLMTLPIDDRPALAVLPSGTGGDFARMLRGPSDVAERIASWRADKLRRVDVGEIAYMRGRELLTRHFINIAGFGFDAEVSRAIGAGAKSKVSYFLHVFNVLRRVQPRRVRLTLTRDGATETVDLSVMMLAVCNGQYFGGGMRVAPMADPCDGAFDVIAIGAMTRLEFALNFPRVYRGAHLTHPKVAHYRASALRIAPDGDGPTLPLEAEGELLGEAPASIRLLREALRVV